MVVPASSSGSATAMVENATSEGLSGPDQTLNIGICNSISSNHEQAKDVVMAVKKRLQDKNPNVQFLSLMLLEMMVKNCGDPVHFQIVEKKILKVMIKIVKKKADMQVEKKILELLDTWQEAFGRIGGKHSQYYYAYEELRRSGVEFPKRSLDAAPTFTPPVTHPTPRITQPEYGRPSNPARMLDETEIESLRLPSIDSMRSTMELLSEMLQAVNHRDPAAVENETIVDLINFCRSSQEKLMRKLTITENYELLRLGPELNASLLSVLAKYDAIASGASGAGVFVIGPNYCHPSTVELEISRGARSTSNFAVRYVNGDVIFKVRGRKCPMPSGVLVDRAGKPVVLIKKQIPTLHGRWVVYKGNSARKSDSSFSVRRPEITGEKTKLVVFFAVNKKENVCDYQMEESEFENLPVIYNGESSTIVAEVHKKAVSTSKETTVVKIHPNIDSAFIVTLVVIHELIKEIDEDERKMLHGAGRFAISAVPVIMSLAGANWGAE